MFELGFIGGHEAKECDPFNQNLYKEKQCMSSIGKCECINAKSGFSTEPKREYRIGFKDKIVCSGTKCLDQAEEAVKMAKIIQQKNMVDLPFLPNCDGMGLYTVS